MLRRRFSHFSVSSNQSASQWFHNQYESDVTDGGGDLYSNLRPDPGAEASVFFPSHDGESIWQMDDKVSDVLM